MTGADEQLSALAESDLDSGVSQRFQAIATDVRVCHAKQVAYSVDMVAEIAIAYDRVVDEGEFLVARCMLDAFYVHLRLLAEFLVLSTKGKKDFGPADLGVTWWSAPEGPERERLKQLWGVASKYVVHFSRARVPKDPQELAAFEVGGKRFRPLAGDALVLFSLFVDRVDAERPHWPDTARLPNPAAEPKMWEARVRSDAADILRKALERAQNHLSQDH